jgi:hypothetical protein
MKTRRLCNIVPSALAISFAVMGTSVANAQVVSINPNFKPDPLVVNGTSGGGNKSNCGSIAATPNQVIQVSQSLPYLRLTVQGGGKPTLLINGPNGRFCVLADANPNKNPEISGYWQAGRYEIYVGQLSPGQHPYSLSISKDK